MERSREGGKNQIRVYPVPQSASLQRDFCLRVRPVGEERWQEVPIFQVKVDMHDVREASMAYFDFTGKAEVEISFPGFYTVYQALVRPLSLGITPHWEPRRVTWVLDRPANMAVEINRDRFHNLHLFAGALEEWPSEGERLGKAPDKNDPNVLVLRGSLESPCFLDDAVSRKLEAMPEGRILYVEPGMYYVGEVMWHLPSHTGIYLEGGAVIRGGLVCDHREDIRIWGRGMIYQGHLERFSSINGLRISHSRNITAEGLMFVNPPHYTVYAGDSRDIILRGIKSFSCEGWSDGLDMMSCQRVLVEDCFLRTSDDCIAIYGSRWDNRGDSRDITVRRTAVWADVAHPLMIGTHGDHENEGDVIEHILYEDVDILEHHEFQSGYLGAMAINAGDKNTVRHVAYRNIRVEAFEHGKLLDVQVKYNPDYNPAPGRRIEDIVFENIHVQSGTGEEPSVIAGYSQEYGVDGVIIAGLYRDGKKVQSLEEANIRVGKYARQVHLT